MVVYKLFDVVRWEYVRCMNLPATGEHGVTVST